MRLLFLEVFSLRIQCCFAHFNIAGLATKMILMVIGQNVVPSFLVIGQIIIKEIMVKRLIGKIYNGYSGHDYYPRYL